MFKVTGCLGLLTAVVVTAACSSGTTSRSPSTNPSHSSATPLSSSVSPSVPTRPATFTSKAYGYTLTAPAGMTPRQAYDKWDGVTELDGSSAEVDLIGDPSETKGVWAAAARTNRDLAADVAYAISWNARVHGDFCPQRPDITSRITIGGRPGVLLSYNCGILVNQAVTVDQGISYWFSFVDRSLAAATNPTDDATFRAILSSVRFPR